MQSSDPIIDELHAIRAAIAAAADNDIRKIAEKARSREHDDGVDVVTLPPKRYVEQKAS